MSMQIVHANFTNARTAADDQQELDPVLMTRIRQPERSMDAT